MLDWFHARIDGTRQIPTLRSYWVKHHAGRIGVEAVAYQWTFVQQGIAEGMPIVPIKRGREGKETRAYVIAARYETGQVYHPVNSPWVPAMEQELIDFPTGAHDDQVDVLSDAGAVAKRCIDPCHKESRSHESVYHQRIVVGLLALLDAQSGRCNQLHQSNVRRRTGFANG